MKNFILFLVFLFSIRCYGQDITSTLAPEGKFIVKDSSNDYFIIDQTTGQVNILRTLKLEGTESPDVGAIFVGVDRFIHTYGTNNSFVGINSGNFTMTGTGENTAVGKQSLFSNTTGTSATATRKRFDTR